MQPPSLRDNADSQSVQGDAPISIDAGAGSADAVVNREKSDGGDYLDIVLCFLFSAIFWVALATIDPYPMDADSSWFWILLRLPLGFGIALLAVIGLMIVLSLCGIQSKSNGSTIDMIAGMLPIYFVVVIAFAGHHLVDVYNASWAAPITAKARLIKTSTSISKQGRHRTNSWTFEIVDGPAKGLEFDTTESASSWGRVRPPGFNEDEYRAVIRHSWMGTSIVELVRY
ncbi:hypothetical protein [Cupriavidus gilardii]|uniref:hypothetical protein n=1 Tax=Cupriavidus gilardii TaxID=82541 RepID=UPI0021BFBE4B|nr:hypothetical protein [Cupriavidus gilardii]MCT9122992.1 hypothetical protein [Cupriavidus gilardii]